MPDSHRALTKHVASLTDAQLIGQLQHLVSEDRRLTAHLLAHLAEVDSRKLYLEHACSSMHRYCVERLHMSEPRAYLRIQAARTAHRFPRIFDMVAHNALHLSAIVLLAPHLTQANHDELLTAARHRSKRALERLLADRFPLPDAPEEIRRLPRLPAMERRPNKPATSATEPTKLPPAELRVEARGAAAHPPRPQVVQPTAPERFKIQFTASASLHDKLREAQALLRHQVPDGNVAELMELALDALLEKTKKRRFAATERPRSNATKTQRRTRQIPSAVRRAVFARDGGRCTFVDAEGNRCNETSFIEFHHIHPFACGGQHAFENITLRCKGHNRLAAEKELGRDTVAAKIREARAAQGARKAREAGASTAAEETTPHDGAPSGRSTPGSQLAWLTPAPLREPSVHYGQRLHCRAQSPPEVTFISAGRGAMATSYGASAKARYGG